MIGIDLRPHQAACVDAVRDELVENDRATLIMPCGTGKTVVACSLAEQLGPDVCVLLEPSLELVGQTLRIWKSLQPMGDEALLVAVCSQDDVGMDGSVLDATSDIEVTLDINRLIAISERARANRKKLVIVGTYHSSAIIAQATKAGLPVDLMVFDEAHRTAVNSRQGVFTACLSDDDCRVGKRVFMTATPRHVASNGETNSYSMDDVAVYGKYAYILSLADAITQGLVTDYRVVVAAVHEEEIPDHIRDSKNSSVILAAAWAIALEKCATELGVKKAITFHDTVATAKSFALSSEIQAGWPVASHINGKMPMGERRGALKAFAETSDNALTTNVRCLSEGVDVPAVDLVGFMSPRGSLTDVVQAVGRAMRVVDGKTAGYVLLPIMITKEDAGDVKAALKRSDMGFIWEVLATLRDMSMPIHQKSLALSKTQPIATDREIDEARQHFKSALLFLGSDELKTKLREAIELVHVDGMRTEWEKSYLWIKGYREAHGTFHLPYGSDENKQYGKFLANARLTYRLEKMSDRIKSLWNDIGFPWDGDAEKLRTQEMHKQAAAAADAAKKEADRIDAQKQKKEGERASSEIRQRLQKLGKQIDTDDSKLNVEQKITDSNPHRLTEKPPMLQYTEKDIEWVVKQMRNQLSKTLNKQQFEILESYANIAADDVKIFSVGNFERGFWTPTSEEKCFRMTMDDDLGCAPNWSAEGYRNTNNTIKKDLAVELVMNMMYPLNKAILLLLAPSLPRQYKTLLIKAVGHEFLISPAVNDVVHEGNFVDGPDRFGLIFQDWEIEGDFQSLRRCGHDVAMGQVWASARTLCETQRGWWFLSHRLTDWTNNNGFGYLDSDELGEGPINNFEGWTQLDPFNHHPSDEQVAEAPGIA